MSSICDFVAWSKRYCRGVGKFDTIIHKDAPGGGGYLCILRIIIATWTTDSWTGTQRVLVLYAQDILYKDEPIG